MESIKGITAKLMKLMEKDFSDSQVAISALQNFDLNLLISKNLEIRRLATGCFFYLLSSPRLSLKQSKTNSEEDILKGKPLRKLYLPLVCMDDLFYLCCVDEQKEKLNTFHDSLIKLVKKSKGFLEKKIMASVPIDTSDGLISSFSLEPFSEISQKFGQIGDLSKQGTFAVV